MPKKVGQYEIGKTLGEGTFGKVKYAVHTVTGEAVAIKVLDKDKIQKQNMGAQIKKEISIMKMIKHPNVVGLKEVLASSHKIFIVLELITGGELFDEIVAAGRFEENVARMYFKQLCAGVSYCHSQGVSHRDLKPENLLLDSAGQLKISDFGLSALTRGDSNQSHVELLHTTCGTPNYVAPEVLADNGYDGPAADTWSIGVILFVLLAGWLPFDEPTMSALFRKIGRAEYTHPQWFSVEVRDLIDSILVVNPEERLTIADIMKHPWMQEGGEVTSTGAGDNGAASGNAAAGAAQADPSNAIALLSQSSGVDLDDEDLESEAGADRPYANVFDLINGVAGDALSRLFDTSGAGASGRKTKKVFTTRPPDDVFARIASSFAEQKDNEVSIQPVNDVFQRITVNSSMGAVIMNVTVRMIAQEPATYLAEISKGKGGRLQFNRLLAVYNELFTAALAADGESAAAAK